jgi:hypothetical protein
MAVLRRLLAILALLSGLLSIAVVAGLFPAAAPTPPLPVPMAPPPPLIVAPTQAVAPIVEPLALAGVPLCDAPAEGARLYPVALSGVPSAFLVWCKGGYALFSLGPAADGALSATRLAQFSSRAVRPGGVEALDINGDRMTDFVLALSAPEGVVHAPGSGAYLVTSRAQGGYENARALLEMPIAALASWTTGPSAADLFLLTRGDVAARRPAEIWWFTGGPLPSLRQKLSLGVDARDLVAAKLDADESPDLATFVRSEGKIVGARIDAAGALVRLEVATPADVQQLARRAQRHDLLVRTTHDVFKLAPSATPELEPWLKDVNLGRLAVGDLDTDGASDVFALTSSGVAHTRGPQEAEAHDLHLPAGFFGRDVSVLADEGAREQAVVLLESAGTPPRLFLAVFPELPWPATTDTVLREGLSRDAPNLAQIPLE